ncbi:MAG: YiiX/YebB-like N1pC/P60 family cysteine hydrolase [Bacteroidales bacterium]
MKVYSATFFIFISLTFIACNSPLPEEKIKAAILQDGDVIFRCGSSGGSRLVLYADKGGVYSHVGILIQDRTLWWVIHAALGEHKEGGKDSVKRERLSSFLEGEKAKRAGVYRYTGNPLLAKNAAQQALELYKRKVLFDHSYNCEDTTAMYCTELIDFVYKKVGVHLVDNELTVLNIPGFTNKIIKPSDLQKSSKLKLLYKY